MLVYVVLKFKIISDILNRFNLSFVMLSRIILGGCCKHSATEKICWSSRWTWRNKTGDFASQRISLCCSILLLVIILTFNFSSTFASVFHLYCCLFLCGFRGASASDAMLHCYTDSLMSHSNSMFRPLINKPSSGHHITHLKGIWPSPCHTITDGQQKSDLLRKEQRPSCV